MNAGACARQAGFTLLEAIVAMVVFTIGAFALYGWLSSNMISLQRVRAQQENEAAVASALDLVRRTNPMQTPSGSRQLGEITVSWESQPLEPVKSGRDIGGAQTIFEVGLYRMDVRVQREGADQARFAVRQIGWRQARAVSAE